MIGKDELVKIAKLNGLKNWQQERHYVQSVALLALSDYPVVFKGGTYLWFFHGLDRFSEDLDFTSNGALPDDLDNRISEALGMYGIENKSRIEMKDGRTFSFRISARGPLNTSEIDVSHVYVEISRREAVLKKPLALKLDLPAYQAPTKIISGMDLGEVAAEKVRAMLTRSKARDAYDMFFLLNKGIKPEVGMVNEKLKYYEKSFSKEEFTERIAKTGKDWKRELGPLIFGELPDFETVEKRLLEAF